MSRVYVASPIGFSIAPESRFLLAAVKRRLYEQGHETVDPWTFDYTQEIEAIGREQNFDARILMNLALARKIGRGNRHAIESCTHVLGILDGMEPDSGTVGEVCYASGMGKQVYGLRTDFRDAGDFLGVPLNLQLLHFIESSGGRLFRAVPQIEIPR